MIMGELNSGSKSMIKMGLIYKGSIEYCLTFK